MQLHGPTSFAVRDKRGGMIGKGKGPMVERCRFNKFLSNFFGGVVHDMAVALHYIVTLKFKNVV